MEKYTEFRLEYFQALKTAEGLRLYEILKSNDNWTHRLDLIAAMLASQNNGKRNISQLNIIDDAIKDINKNTELSIHYTIDGPTIIFRSANHA